MLFFSILCTKEMYFNYLNYINGQGTEIFIQNYP